MDFKLFKRHVNRTSVLTFILFIVAIIIGVAIVGSGYTSKDSGKDIGKLLIIIIDGLLMAIIIWLIHLSSWFVSSAYQITKKKYITKQKTTEVIKFTNPLWLHFLTFFFFAVIYILSITALSSAYDGWADAAQHTWWIMLIILFVNLAIYEFAYNLNLYKFNHDQKIINTL